MASVASLMRKLRHTVLGQSHLDMLIPPEVVNDSFSVVIRDIASAPEIRTAIEIGSSSGAGTTASLVAGMRNKDIKHLYCLELSRPRFEKLVARYRKEDWVHCYNLPSVSIEQMPSADDVRQFYDTHPESPIRRHTLPEVEGWLRQDIEYIERMAPADTGIAAARRDSGVDLFDLVLIDGSEFTGEAELDALYGARYVLLDDTMTFKCHSARQRLHADPEYQLVVEDPTCRNGFAAFERR